jgi:uncharacterized Zn finger protein
VHLAGYIEQSTRRYVALPSQCPTCGSDRVACGEVVEHGDVPPYTIERPMWRCLSCGWTWSVAD